MRLIDVFRVEDKLFAWLLDDQNNNQFLECSYTPKFYVYATKQQLAKLQHRLSSHNIKAELELKKTVKGKKQVLEITTSIQERDLLVKQIDKFGGFTYEFFNADLPLEELYLFEHDVFPSGRVSLQVDQEGRVVKMIPEESWREEYSLPKLKAAAIKIKTEMPRKENPELLSITFNGNQYQAEEIPSFLKDFANEDVDIIVTNETLDLAYLLVAIRKYQPDFSFSRVGKDQPVFKGISCFSHGKVVHQDQGFYLKGRLHFKKKSMLYGSWTPWYPFELARACRVTLQKINHRSIGYGVSNLQLYFAMKHNFLLPKKTSCVEVWKSGYELFEADRGAFIYEPLIGYHDQIAEIDFVSLFPNIMVKYNISTETLFCSCCRNNKVPSLNINICKRTVGIIPKLLGPLIQQRLFYKHKKKESHEDRANALKCILVCCFGYMGFKKSKFARIEAHQAIQAYAREVLLAASKIAEQHGFEVIHGYVDSLWVKKKGITKEAVQKLIDDLLLSLGFEAKLEGIYRWIVFLPSTKHHEIPVPNHFYGVFDDGSMKCRGIAVRTHDTPPLIAELQTAIIKELSNADSYASFLAAMKSSRGIVEQTIARLLLGFVAGEDLLITKQMTKTEYKSNIPQAIIAKKLQKEGHELNPGNYLAYLITNKASTIPEQRYTIQKPQENLQYDTREYVRLAKKAAAQLFLPFDHLREKQLTLHQSLSYARKTTATEKIHLQITPRPR